MLNHVQQQQKKSNINNNNKGKQWLSYIVGNNIHFITGKKKMCFVFPGNVSKAMKDYCLCPHNILYNNIVLLWCK